MCNSHIVPQFIFKKLTEEDGQFHVFKSSSKTFEHFYRTFAEKLLCAHCETLFSKFESYAKQFLSDDLPLVGDRQSGHVVLHGLDYAKIKLFFMSLLWRFAVSANPWIAGCDFGPHAERLRQLLLHSDTAEQWRYGCVVTAVMLDGSHLRDFIVPPTICRIDKQRCARLVVGGFLLSYSVGNHAPTDGSQRLFVQENGTLIFTRRELCDIPFLARFVAEAGQTDLMAA